ncbi:MAG: glycerol-3-phosphate acyltransferase [Clostridia bacterium]|nr:glycerol-3-phosphate acyltransferase [Clostridia bacterium]
MFWLWTLIILGGFLLGSIMFSRFLPLLILKKDVCKLGKDGNPGVFNVFSFCGVGMGTVCLLLDMAKGFLPVFLGCMLLDTENIMFCAVIAAPVLGHALGMFNGFHGGKCISTSFGVVLGLMPITWVGWILAGLYIFFSIFIKINPHSLRSILSFVIFGVASCIILMVQEQYSLAIGCLLLAAIATIKHIKRMPVDEQAEQELQEEQEKQEGQEDFIQEKQG